MKRHPAIQPLSRQHHELLLAVLLLKKGQNKHAPFDIMRSFLQQVWQKEWHPHTLQEEEILIPIMHELGETAGAEIIHAEHLELEALYNVLMQSDGTEVLRSFLLLAEQHIRDEERIHFPAIQSKLQPQHIARLQALREPEPGCIFFEPRFWE